MLLFVFDRSVFRTCFILLCTYFFCCSIVKVQFFHALRREPVYYITTSSLCQYLFWNFFKKFFDSVWDRFLPFFATALIFYHFSFDLSSVFLKVFSKNVHFGYFLQNAQTRIPFLCMFSNLVCLTLTILPKSKLKIAFSTQAFAFADTASFCKLKEI